MSPVPVTIGRKPPAIRPELPAAIVAAPTVVPVDDVDDLLEGVACSCSGSDDNPH
ncbi:hypothetical protein GTW40_14390 [Streptomyces sp. SID4985]|uniref:hypothetical protein n=1 Tax=unclassified Streptomyces TaxID=2593676 RepID=UPI001380DF27|nr:hypothetical protein [Streptomyces sp. SID4985]MYQ46227.1 hypothetical protein [Streptomyces sp. SID4985]